MSGSIKIISCFFNHTGSSVLLQNLQAFYESLGRFRDRLVILECVQPGSASQLDHVPNVVTVQARSVLWQKERLLNLALEQLGADTDTVIWCDTDLEFENEDWVGDVDRLLTKADFAQPFTSVVQKPRLAEPPAVSFAANVEKNPELAHRRFHDHGHTGYAWAIRRDIIERAGFFDECVLGGADHVMAHAFTGTYECDCIAPLLGDQSILSDRYRAWSRRLLDGRPSLQLGCLPGRVHHRRHGSAENRMYITRNRLLDQSGFDPERHLTKNAFGCWEWTPQAALQQELANEYFRQRQEDQVLAAAV